MDLPDDPLSEPSNGSVNLADTSGAFSFTLGSGSSVVLTDSLDSGQFANVNPDQLFEQSWHAIGRNPIHNVWDTGFWADVLHPLSNLVDDLLRVQVARLKEPQGEDELEMTFEPPLQKTSSCQLSTSCTEFNPWQESRDAQWQTAIRRWRTLILSWNQVLRLLRQLHRERFSASILKSWLTSFTTKVLRLFGNGVTAWHVFAIV